VFRTINLKDLVDEGEYSLVENKIEISIPIFLRPHMTEILSIGKSIKIVRFLEKTKLSKDNLNTFESFYDKYIIDIKSILQHSSILKPTIANSFNYMNIE
jgi:DNA primase catalytic subunit